MLKLTTKIYYDLLPDYSVSVLVYGSTEWDVFRSMNNLCAWADAEIPHYELVDITNTTAQQRMNLGVFDGCQY